MPSAEDIRSIGIKLNNAGVDLLERGDYEEASAVFKKALDGMIKTDPAGGNSSNQTSESVKRQPGRNCHHTIQRLNEEGSFLYCHAFRILQIAKPTSQNMTCYIRDASVIMYNLALVKQLQHITAKTDGTRNLLMKSLHLYRVVHHLVATDNHTRAVAGNDPYFRLVLMATFNNMASIHHSVCQYQDATSCLNTLSTLLTQAHLSNATSFMDRNALHGFHMNLVLLVEPLTAPAA